MRISFKEWNYIGVAQYARPWARRLCSYHLTQYSNMKFGLVQKIGWFSYALLFIPTNLIQLIYLIWDGGIKEFEIPDRHLGGTVLYSWDNGYEKCEEIFQKHLDKSRII